MKLERKKGRKKDKGNYDLKKERKKKERKTEIVIEM